MFFKRVLQNVFFPFFLSLFHSIFSSLKVSNSWEMRLKVLLFIFLNSFFLLQVSRDIDGNPFLLPWHLKAIKEQKNQTHFPPIPPPEPGMVEANFSIHPETRERFIKLLPFQVSCTWVNSYNFTIFLSVEKRKQRKRRKKGEKEEERRKRKQRN